MDRVGEAPSNWLSGIIEEQRRKIERLRPRIERRDERDAIVEAIKAHPEGAPLAANPGLADIVSAALDVADERERELKAKPDLMAPSPAVQASFFIFEKLGLPVPE
jgi:hypothetical protein